MHKHNDVDAPLEKCMACKKPLSHDTSWNPHAVRIFVMNADPQIVKRFIDEVKNKNSRQHLKKGGIPRKRSPRTTKKVA